jgi:hypothetical protein
MLRLLFCACSAFSMALLLPACSDDPVRLDRDAADPGGGSEDASDADEDASVEERAVDPARDAGVSDMDSSLRQDADAGACPDAGCERCDGACTGADAGGSAPCQVALYLIADLSNSMNQAFRGASDAGAAADAGPGDAAANSKVEGMKHALQDFFADPGSAGLSVGLGHYPIARPDGGTGCAPGTECTSSSNGVGCCPNGAQCIPFLGCLSAGPTSSCEVSDYATPDVELGALPQAAGALQAAVSTFKADGQSPEIPALEGALSYARGKVEGPRKPAVVLFADGPWTACGRGDAGMGAVGPLVEVAERYARGTPPVHTYVVAIRSEMRGDPDAGFFDPVADAGGTGQAYNATSSGEIGAALRAIRAHASEACR